MGGGGGKGGGVPDEFIPALDKTNTIMDAIMGLSGSGLSQLPFGSIMPLGAMDEMNRLHQQAQTGFGQIGANMGPELFGQAMTGLGTGMEEGYIGNVLEGVESRLRPMAELSKDYLTADILEGSSLTGTTKSTHTAESIGRGMGGIEAGLQQTLGGIEGQLAPLQAQQKERATMAGLGLPASINAQLNQIPSQGQDMFKFLANLPVDLLGAAGGYNSVPYQPASNPFGDFLAFASPILGPVASDALGKLINKSGSPDQEQRANANPTIGQQWNSDGSVNRDYYDDTEGGKGGGK